MTIFLIVFCTIGWIVGVWAPWWCTLCLLVALSIASLDDKNFSGLDGGILQFTLWVAIMIACVSGFINGDVSFHDVGSIIKAAFTGY